MKNVTDFAQEDLQRGTHQQQSDLLKFFFLSFVLLFYNLIWLLEFEGPKQLSIRQKYRE